MSKAKILEELAERVKGGDSLAMDFASRMQRAKEQGFDTDTVYYHGTASDFDSFKPNSMVGSDVNYANTFAKMRGRERSEGANVIPVLINKGNQYEMIDYPEDTPYSMMRDQSDEALIADGYDSKKRYDGAITVFDPSNIRSVNAAFDPTKKDSSNLLASAGAGIGALGLMGASDDSEASFIGTAAKTWNKGAEALAKKMASEGASRDEIWQATGQMGSPTFKDVDGKWKQEISDSDITYNQPTKGQGLTSGQGYEDLAKANNYTDDAIAQLMELDDFGGSADEYRDMLRARATEQINDITKDPFTSADVFNNPSLSSAYPSFDSDSIRYRPQIGFGGADGQYNPSDRTMTIKPDNPDNASILSHEAQHKIQDLEGFAMGGNLSSAERAISAQKADEIANFNDGYYKFNSVANDLKEMRPVEHYNQYKNLSKKENIKPSQITNSSYFYEYSDQIRNKLGAMPKKKGDERDRWLQDAAAIISNKIEDKFNYSQKFYKDMIDKEGEKVFKSELRKRERVYNKNLDAYKGYRDVEDKYKKYDEMQDFDKYKRLAGEAEARNVQTRLDYDMNERIANPPWSTLDVPENELILRDLGAGLAATGGLSSLLAQGGEPMPTGIAYAPKSETLGYLSNLLQRVETPIGYPFGGLADYINKFNYGDDIGYLDRLATIPDPTEFSKLFE